MSSKESLSDPFSSLNIGSGVANLLLNLLPLLCLSLCSHSGLDQFLFFTPSKRYFSTSLQLEPFWDINCISLCICET